MCIRDRPRSQGGLGARFVYTIELRDTGHHGFLLPENQIKPSGEELWEAERVIFKKMIEVSNPVSNHQGGC